MLSRRLVIDVGGSWPCTSLSCALVVPGGLDVKRVRGVWELAGEGFRGGNKPRFSQPDSDVTTTSLPDPRSRQTKRFGIPYGRPGGVPEPNDMPLIPCFASNGIAALVQPGTSRVDTAVEALTPSLAAIRSFSSRLASNIPALGK